MALDGRRQRTAQGAEVAVPSGRMGIWWLIASEIAIFGGLVATYILFRLRHPEWAEAASHTWFAIGAINTIVLLTSSLAMVLAHAAVSRGRHAAAQRALGAALALGLLFLVFKGVEYSREIAHGMVPSAGLFWSFYYLMTGFHALHVIAGLVAIGCVMGSLARGQNLQRVENAGLYWHFVDTVWIFLFPLLYLAH